MTKPGSYLTFKITVHTLQRLPHGCRAFQRHTCGHTTHGTQTLLTTQQQLSHRLGLFWAKRLPNESEIIAFLLLFALRLPALEQYRNINSPREWGGILPALARWEENYLL